MKTTVRWFAAALVAVTLLHAETSAKTLAFDSKPKKLFMPAADYLESPNMDKSKRPARTAKPRSFGVLIVSKD